MSDKRFKVIDNSFSMWIVDTTLKEDRHEGNIYTAYDMCRKLNELYEENEQLRQKIKHCVYVDVDNESGCMNCKYDIGGICSILDCGTHDYLEGVSECDLKYWELEDE